VITSKSSARRILVVDDVVLSQDLFREFLERAGHKVEVASNGREAVEAARKKAYDVILMDMSMPEMDGLEATRLIRAENAGRPQARIIICTANAQAFPQGDFKTAGVDAVLRKPLGQAELYATIDGVLKSEALPAKAPPDIAPEAIDGLELLSLLGPVRLIAALEVLKAELCALPTFISGEEKDLRNVGRQAHAMITTACMLNMPELADGLRELENACDEQCNSCNLSCNASRILEDMRPIIEMSSMKAETLSRQLKSRIMH
jgi:CheY-like chemotaxis protein